MKNKRNVFLSLALGATVAFGAGLFALNPFQTSAEISVDETTKTASEGFQMKAGASVRRVDTNGDKVNDQVGIRFTTEVSADFESYLSTTYEGATFEYGTLITAQNILTQMGKTITDMTVENKAELQCNNPTDEVENGKFYGSVLYTSENGVDWETLTEAQKLAIYKTELVARSYVKITQGETVNYIYAKAEDTARSIRGVANAAILDNDGALLDGYIGTATREKDSFDYYDPELKAGNIGVEELADGTYTVYVNAKLYGEVTVENGTFKLPELAMMTAGEHSVSLFDESANVYSTPFVYPTKVLTKADDLAMFDLNNVNGKAPTVKWDGYYVLGNDIDASNYTHKSIGYTTGTTNYTDLGLTGTFDGLGHKIMGITFGGNASQYDGTSTDNSLKAMDYSLFGVVSGGTVKNVGIVNASFSVNEKVTMAERATLANQIRNATIENVYIQLDGLNFVRVTFNSQLAGVATSINANTKMKNCIFDIGDDGTLAALASEKHPTYGELYYLVGFGALSADGGQYLNNTYTDVTDRDWENVYVISPFALSHERVSSSNNTHWEWYGANLSKTESKTAHSFVKYENVTQYLSHEDMIVANIDYETLGFTADKGWKIVEGYVPTWNGVKLEKTVNYTVNLDDEKTQLSEDDLYALFGDKKATLLSASTSDSTYGISYTAGALSVTGAEWNGETFTAVFNDGSLEVTATVRLCTEVITRAEELGVFCLDNTDYAAFASVAAKDKLPSNVVDGYYVLGNDIDVAAENWAMPTQGLVSTTYNTSTLNGTSVVGFQGTFDGCGYTISNLVLGTDQGDRKNANGDYVYDTAIRTSTWNNNTYSLFGIIGKNATVKNVAITNVSYMLKNTQNGATLSMNAAICSGLATWICAGASVENVYVSVKGVTAGGSIKNTMVISLAYGIYSGAKLNNIVVDCTYSGSDVTVMDKTASFVYRKANESSVTEITGWTNVYVLSDKALAYDSSNLLCAGNDTTSAGAKVTNLCQYASLEAWKAAQDSETTATNFDSFKNGFWTVDKVPTWN